VALGVTVAVVAGVVAGAPAARGVLVGTAIVVVVFASGMAVTHAAAALSPALSLLVAMLTYVLQLVLLVIVLMALERSSLLEATLDRGWIGATIIAGALVWSAALVREAMLRTAQYHSPDPGSESRDEPASQRPPGEEPAG
jgi:ATP synthase protein I